MAKLKERRAARLGGSTTTPVPGDLTDPATTAEMPDPNDPLAREAERRKAAIARLRGGRLSTILTDTLKKNTGTGRIGA